MKSRAVANLYPPGVVLHVPHNSTVIPPEVREQFVLDDDELHTEFIRMTDHLTLDLFCGMNSEIPVVVAPFSRLVVDVERFEKDEDEPMAAKGMGAIYMLTSDQKPLRRSISEKEHRALIDLYYRPHHEKLNRVVEDVLVQHGHCVVLDCHSFPSIPLPYELDKKTLRPDICIGTDEFHTPGELSESFVRVFQNAGFTVSVNTPFSGALVPLKYYRRDERVFSIMVEVNRLLYCDENTGAPLDNFVTIANKISACCRSAVLN